VEAIVPLSEDEQRILNEIEARLYESDPRFARGVSETTVYTQSFRRLKWASVGFVVSLVGMIITLQISYALAFVAFLAMFACAIGFEQSARRLGRTGLQQYQQRRRRWSDMLGGRARQIRRPGRRGDADAD
jgi:hypothetical protein